ncbi:hypothetical protein ACFSL4_23550 [Streptomyces caeni]|uniref:Uncharacterized protein n=1 Tax=Streptomyces caeni TaxID=2307231 RepID=A0ABW4IUP7_9ACTN
MADEGGLAQAQVVEQVEQVDQAAGLAACRVLAAVAGRPRTFESEEAVDAAKEGGRPLPSSSSRQRRRRVGSQ